MKNIAVFGATGAIGNAFCQQLAQMYPAATIHAIARQTVAFDLPNVYTHTLDFEDEDALQALMAKITQKQPLDAVLVAIGLLHDAKAQVSPEKSLQSLNAQRLHQLYHTNAVLPMIIAKYALPALCSHATALFAVLSARVGSISDNRLGGWYGYRMAKSSLNMGIKNLSIEVQRKNPQAIVVALHPGTVNSPLSKPFQKNVASDKLFSPTFSAQSLLAVLASLTPEDSGKIWAWDGQEILP